jgi:glyceraldehyde 3-phosphate dehydrogenase
VLFVKIAINGFGRIGRCALRAAVANGSFGKGFDLVAINDPSDAKALAHLLKYDSVHGKFNADIKTEEKALIVDGKRIALSSELDPTKLPWQALGVELVIECTGKFTDKEGASKHITAGAKKVLISAPGKGVDATIVPGINEQTYDRAKHTVVCMASCTTNSLAPVLKTIQEKFGVKKGFMTTVHAYTNDQRILDVGHKDPRRARAAAVNIIPTTTGAAKAIGEVIPELKGKMDGLSLRVPVPDGSVTDISIELEKEAKKEEINAALKEAANGKLRGILEFSEEPLVSSDIVGNPNSAIVDGLSTIAIGNSVKILSWYDNEWGYSNRLVELACRM